LEQSKAKAEKPLDIQRRFVQPPRQAVEGDDNGRR
jgi:hypothetical protein